MPVGGRTGRGSDGRNNNNNNNNRNKNNNRSNQNYDNSYNNNKPRSVVILTKQLNSTTNKYENNYYEWEQSVILGLSLDYGEDINYQVQNKSKPTSLKKQLRQWMDKTLYDTSKDSFVLTEPQLTEIESIIEGDDADIRLRRENLYKTFYVEWVAQRRELNKAIQLSNEEAKTEREKISKSYSKYTSQCLAFVKALLETISYGSQQLLLTYKEELPHEAEHNNEEESQDIDVQYHTYEEAVSEGDFLFVLRAAEKTHAIKDEMAESNSGWVRIKAEKMKLSSLSQQNQDFIKWNNKYDRQVRLVRSLTEISEVDLRNEYMSSINDVLFKEIKRKYFDLDTGPTFNRYDTYEKLKDRVHQEYSNIELTDPSLISIAKREIRQAGEKTELSFKTQEKKGRTQSEKKSEDPGAPREECPLCLGRGCYGKKDPTKCKKFNADFPIGKNIWYQKMQRAKEERKQDKEEKKEETKEIVKRTTIVLFNKVPDSSVELKENLSNSEDFIIDKQYIMRMGVKKGEYDFLYDTCAEGNVTGSKKFAAGLEGVHKEKVVLEGIGGAQIISHESGHGLFGKYRILPTLTDDSNVVSQYAIKKLYKTVQNDNEDEIILTPWPKGHNNYNTALEGVSWRFIRDYDRYGDNLLHCTVSEEKLRVLSTRVERYYNPERPDDRKLSQHEEEIIQKVEALHTALAHSRPPGMLRAIDSNHPLAKDLIKEDIDLWNNLRGKFCSGCIEGGMKEHDRVASSKPKQEHPVGAVAEADLMFVEERNNKPKVPVYVNIDKASKFITIAIMKGKKVIDLQRAFLKVLDLYRLYKKKLEKLEYDRESGVVAIADWMLNNSVLLECRAAGQAAALAEVTIRDIRRDARCTKAGSRADYGYTPPPQWNLCLLQDVVSVINRRVRPNETISPYEQFTGESPNDIRNWGAKWGEPVIVEKPKGISSDLGVTGQWAVIVRRMFDGSGVNMVYILQSKKFAFRHKYVRAIAPEWVKEILRNLNPSDEIGFEDTSTDYSLKEQADIVVPEQIVNMSDLVPNTEADNLLEDYLDPIVEGDMAADPELQEAFDHFDGVETGADYDNPPELVESDDEDEEEPKRVSNRNKPEFADQVAQEREAEKYAEWVARGWHEPDDEDRELVRGRKTDLNIARMRGKLKEAYMRRLAVDPGAVEPEIVNLVNEVNKEHINVFYDQAKKTRPVEAETALEKEVMTGLRKGVWEPQHWNDLTPEEQKLVLPMMKNYIEKYNPDGTFEKSKVRVLVRGDLQYLVGETEGPVARVESIFLLIAIATYLGLVIFKVDMTAAYCNTDMPNDFKHKWLKLDRDVVRILLKLEPGKWEEYVCKDGTVLVRMKKISYGYKEAAYYWYKTLTAVFFKAGYKALFKDLCVLYKKSEINGEELFSMVAITVDDCLFAATQAQGWKDQQIDMLKEAFTDLTVSEGDELSIIGMSVSIDRKAKAASISQKNYALKFIETWGVNKKAVTPMLGELYSVDDSLPILKNQNEYMSLVATELFGATRTYPDLKPYVTQLSTRYNKANQVDFDKAMRLAEYIVTTADIHKVVLAPKSLQLVACSDANYAECEDGKSVSGGCVGFLDPDMLAHCWLIWISLKQPVVAKSTGESELISASTVGDFLLWAIEFMEELGFKQSRVKFFQDNQTAILNATRGYGSFKRSKHIKVRFFWLKFLVEDGTIEMVYVPTDELVADVLTKPMGGSKFKYLRAKLLGWGGAEAQG